MSPAFSSAGVFSQLFLWICASFKPNKYWVFCMIDSWECRLPRDFVLLKSAIYDAMMTKNCSNRLLIMIPSSRHKASLSFHILEENVNNYIIKMFKLYTNKIFILVGLLKFLPCKLIWSRHLISVPQKKDFFALEWSWITFRKNCEVSFKNSYHFRSYTCKFRSVGPLSSIPSPCWVDTNRVPQWKIFRKIPFLDAIAYSRPWIDTNAGFLDKFIITDSITEALLEIIRKIRRASFRLLLFTSC